MAEKIIYISGIGEILLKKTKRARRLSIKVKPFGGVIAVIPPLVTYKTAENFIREKQDWIKSSLSKMEQIEEKRTVFTENTRFCTLYHCLKIEKAKGKRFYTQITGNEIKIKYPHNIAIRDERVQAGIRKAIEKAWLVEAWEVLPKKTLELAKKHGFKYKSLTVKNTVSRWGSCSYDNRINLSLHLMRLPEHLIEHVILHELCHTIVKNHGKNFWALLEKVNPGARKLAKELKNYDARIY
ncbi:MAG: M48 family metallopeptidase [Bacteroidales bacterium]|nr:M48 family metallopeptidase [Bacteroidales bacterium]